MAKRFFLRKMGTNEVFVWTRLLAQRADMKPIDEKEALRLMDVFEKQQVEESVAKRAKQFEMDSKAAELHAAEVDGEVEKGGQIKLPRSKKDILKFAADQKIAVDEDASYKEIKEDVLAAIKGQGQAFDPDPEPEPEAPPAE